jgi:hypothetical protein
MFNGFPLKLDVLGKKINIVTRGGTKTRVDSTNKNQNQH